MIVSNGWSETLLSDLTAGNVSPMLVEIAQNGGAHYPASNDAMLHVVLRGKALLTLRGTLPVQQLTAGDTVLALYGDPHSIVAAVDDPVINVTFKHEREIPDEIKLVRVGDGGKLAMVLSASMDLAYLPRPAKASRAVPNLWVLHPHGSEEEQDCAFRFDPQQIEACCFGPGATAFATMIANFHLTHMFRVAKRRVWADRNIEMRSPNTRRISIAVQKIRSYPSRNWTLDGLAGEVGMSRSNFAKMFQEYIGVTPVAYLTDQRMRHAASLLAIEAISLREIAHRVGYDLEDSFSRAFKRHYRITPREYRKCKVNGSFRNATQLTEINVY
jgi:AraC-like DNA-binding protein/quercetin dioxygenase-like cupin family protein